MGVVFEAEQISLKRRVALKLILAGEFASEVEIARFHEEADALASLDHPGIVPIYSIGEDSGRHFYSMKLLEGGSLEHKLAEYSNQARRSAELLARISRAVHAAHQAGILHRDLKAGNILFDAEGSPYVTDFGLARFFARSRTYTASDAVPGTPDYLAPERLKGLKTQTTASDVWSLGILLYRLLTGTAPFVADSIPELLRAIAEKDPKALPRGFDPDLRTICMKCLEKNPAARYGSAEALAEDLERWLKGRPILARPIGMSEAIGKWMLRHPWQAISAAAGLAALIGPVAIAVWFILHLNHERGHHPIVALDSATNDLPIRIERSDRITDNFAGFTFSARLNQRIRIEFLGVPAKLGDRMKVRFKADWAAMNDPVRSIALGHGECGVVRAEVERLMLQDTFLYLEAVGWSSTQVLSNHPAAAVRLIFLDGSPTNIFQRLGIQQ